MEEETPDFIEEICEDEKENDTKREKKIMFDIFKYLIVNATILTDNIAYDGSWCDIDSLNISSLASDSDIEDTVDRLWELQEKINNVICLLLKKKFFVLTH